MRTLFKAPSPFFKALGLSLALAALPVIAQAPVDVRIALVIGNSAYAGAAALDIR